MTLNLADELDRVVADARAHGLTSIDLAALERLLHRHSEMLRRDLLRRDDMLVVDLT
jgi:hypothetical protein